MSDPARRFLDEGTLFVERYEVVRQLGAGGMGAVYEVMDTKTRRRRALKVMLPQVVANEDLRRRFQREATVAADIVSDHVAETLDAGVDEETKAPFIVMELLEGQELGQLVKSRGRLPPEDVDLYLSQAAVALEKAHGVGVVHRDLKPENLFVTYADDGSPRIKILDFGIAKVVSETMSGPQTQGILGSPMYMAPEQMHGEAPISPQTDVYALGQIAYALLAGEPYWAPERDAVDGLYPLLMKMAKGPVQPPSERARERRGVTLPEAFDAWFAKATAREPEARFDGALALVMGLADVLSLTSSSLAMPAAPAARQEGEAAPQAAVEALSASHGERASLGTAKTELSGAPGIEGGSTTTPVTSRSGVPLEPARWPWLVLAALVVGAGVFVVRSLGGESSGSASGETEPTSTTETAVAELTSEATASAPAPSASASVAPEPSASTSSDPRLAAPPARPSPPPAATARPPAPSEPPPTPTPPPPSPAPGPTGPQLPSVR